MPKTFLMMLLDDIAFVSGKRQPFLSKQIGRWPLFMMHFITHFYLLASLSIFTGFRNGQFIVFSDHTIAPS